MTTELPNGARPWDNHARLSLSKGLYIWLGILVLTCLASTVFAPNHVPARGVLGGFVLSHLIVFGLPSLIKLNLRIGMVGLLHLACWSPGWLMVILDSAGRAGDAAYAGWSYGLIAVLAISFFFDARDGWGYLRWRSANIKSAGP